MVRCSLLLMIVALACSAALAGSTVAAGELPGFSKTAPLGVRSVKVEGGYLTPYTATLPGADIQFEMLPVPGGEVRLGLPEGESFEPADDGFDVSPRVTVRVEPFWVGKHEVTWAEYRRFMQLNETFAKLNKLRTMVNEGEQKHPQAFSVLKKQGALWATLNKQPTFVDGVTSPTPLYYPEITYESGEDPELPAVSMTQYAARQYTKWLSLILGVDYRLPGEAEWEHAARAGKPSGKPDLAKVAWHEDNADYAAHHVGKLAPNAWGLHDTLGNAAEWVLDAPSSKQPAAAKQPLSGDQAIHWPQESFPHIAKGGYWDGSAEHCHVASRLLSEEWWKDSDPNLPKSPWWFSDAPSFGVGFRLVRPFKPMNDEMKTKAWEIDHEDLQDDVDNRLKERRGKLGVINPTTPKSVEQLSAEEVRALME